jgi:hypothetical protein
MQRIDIKRFQRVDSVKSLQGKHLESSWRYRRRAYLFIFNQHTPKHLIIDLKHYKVVKHLIFAAYIDTHIIVMS